MTPPSKFALMRAGRKRLDRVNERVREAERTLQLRREAIDAGWDVDSCAIDSEQIAGEQRLLDALRGPDSLRPRWWQRVFTRRGRASAAQT